MSKRRLWTLAKKRIVHVIVVALNFLHDGCRFSSLRHLGRSPSLAQKAVHRRLLALVTVCDSPDLEAFPMPPGRSGFEFILQLLALENFVRDYIPDESSYSDCRAGDPESVGFMKKQHVPKLPERPSPLVPYRSLDAQRLKLTGEGLWPLHDFLDDILWLPFLEPAILRHGRGGLGLPVPITSLESRSENLKLARLWDTKGLLCMFVDPPYNDLRARVFNAFKSEAVDRQIGDRRAQNAAECHPVGPSRWLPSGQSITALHCPRGFKLTGSVTDRKDFYHQAQVSRSRAHSNCIPFWFSSDEFPESRALDILREELGQPTRRDVHGDRYGMPARKAKGAITSVCCGFASLYQGDHLGVEYALSAHSTLLKRGGLLADDSRLETGKAFPRGPLWQGLVIDDYFAISCERKAVPCEDTLSMSCLRCARSIYSDNKVLGSPEKDVTGASSFKVVGAEVDSSSRTRAVLGTTVGAPRARRFSMAALSLRVACLPCISRTVASRVTGNWISILMYRRCLTSTLAKIFSCGVQSGESSDEVVSLPRPVAQELVLAAIFSLVAVSDVSCPYDDRVYASDSSSSRGAVVSREVSPSVVEAIWLAGDRRGHYTRMDSQAKELRTIVGDPDELHTFEEFLSSPTTKQPDFTFDFVEICGGSGILSEEAAKLGLTVCTPIDISSSPHFDVRNRRLVLWIIDMLEAGRFSSIMLEPVCTTFSPAAHPAVRSYEVPLGHDTTIKKVIDGNVIALNCLTLLFVAGRLGRPSLLEQPRLSKMAWLRAWRALLELGFDEAALSSCQFGSIHRKDFRFIGKHVDMASLKVLCPGGHQHVRIEGAYTKASAMYTRPLAKFLAKAFHKALRMARVRDEADDLKVQGHESALVNDLLLTGDWRIERQWQWLFPAHINVLESNAYVDLLRIKTLQGGCCRTVALLDSRVAKGAQAKGRSSSKALLSSLRKSTAYQIAGNIYPSLGFSPTRLNVADDPTRLVPLRSSCPHSLVGLIGLADALMLHAEPVRRPFANWIRLVVLAVSLWTTDARHSVSAGSVEASDKLESVSGTSLSFVELLISWTLGFWTYGFWIFSRIGPLCLVVVLWTFAVSAAVALLLRCGCQLRKGTQKWHLFFLVALASSCSHGNAVPMRPEGPAENCRAERRAATEIRPERTVKPRTRDYREVLLGHFEVWTYENFGLTLKELVDDKEADPEILGDVLVQYGQEMYYAGKPYGRFAETINGIAARRPALRKQMCAPWNLAFSWVHDEPHQHHPAMPASVMIAMTGLALLWGWPAVAAMISMAWCGLMRIGEALAATRADLILPSDAAPGVSYALVQIKEPKTRGRAAKHQVARIDPRDIVLLLELVYRNYAPGQRLWHMSPSSFRKRFNQLQHALGLVAGNAEKSAQFEPASLRPGGATHLLHQTDDAELVRRRGRWLSTRVLEIYLQEASVASYTQRLSEQSKRKITEIGSIFERILDETAFFVVSGYPCTVWQHLWAKAA